MKIFATIMLALAASVAAANPAIDAAALEQATHPDRRTVSGAVLENLDQQIDAAATAAAAELDAKDSYPANVGDATVDEGYPRKECANCHQL